MRDDHNDLRDSRYKTVEVSTDAAKVFDVIQNPQHYTRGSYECWDVMNDLGIDKCFYLAAAFKYLWRAGHKDDIKKDLQKAVAYLNRKISLIEASEKS